jgi:glutamate-1-semialdehyde 2,1-aminomutase
VISFRIGYHGAQGYFGAPSRSHLAGQDHRRRLPVGAVGGRAEVMAGLRPRGGTPIVPHAGTFNANPVTMAAGWPGCGCSTPRAFRRWTTSRAGMRDGLAACFKDAGVEGSVTGVGSLFKIHPSSHTLVDYRSSRPDAEEAARLDRIVRYLLDHGVLLSTTGLGCLSTPMAEPEVESFLEVFTAALAAERGAAP